MTGDAVVLELRLAKLPSRALAFGIDLAIMLAAFVGVVLLITGSLVRIDDALGAAVGLVLTLAVFVGYPITCETLTRGRTVGKIALGLRVVRDDAGPIRFRHALARGLAGFIVDFGIFSAFTGVVAIVSSLVSTKGKRIGDLLAGTVVLRERVAAQPGPVMPMPPALARWAAELELSRLSDDLALAGRQFLQRAGQLDPHVRVNMAGSLANEVSRQVSPPAPQGTPPEPYLAAVLAERRRREEVRLGAARQPWPAAPYPPSVYPPHPPPQAPPNAHQQAPPQPHTPLGEPSDLGEPSAPPAQEPAEQTDPHGFAPPG